MISLELVEGRVVDGAVVVVVVVVASGAAGFDARDRTGKAAKIFCSGAIVLRGVSAGAGGVRFLGGELINGRHV